MLSKITFSLVLLSAVLVLTSFYGNDKEEQEDYVTYTLFVENLKPDKKEITLNFPKEMGIDFTIITDKKVDIKGIWQRENSKIFTGSIREESPYGHGTPLNKLKIVGKNDNYTILSIELKIKASSRKSEINLSGIHVKDKIEGKFSQLVANDTLNMCIESKSSKSKIIDKIRDKTLQFSLGDKSNKNNELCLSFLCSRTDDVFFTISDNDISPSGEKINESLRDKASKPILNSLSFKLNRPNPVKEEVTPEEKPTKPEKGDTVVVAPTTPEIEEQDPQFPQIENINLNVDLATLNFTQEDTTFIVPVESANNCTPPCTIKITNHVDIKGQAKENNTEIKYKYRKDVITMLDAENREKEDIKFKLIDSGGVESQGEGSLIITFKKPLKSIPDGINLVNINEIPPITQYKKNSFTDMTLGYRVAAPTLLNPEHTFLLLWVSSFPIDTSSLIKSINSKAQNIARLKEDEIQNFLYRDLKINSVDEQITEDFTLKIFDNKTEETAYRQGKNRLSTYPVYHFGKQDNTKGYYAFARLKPYDICKGTGVELYLTFENNNLYTPVKIYAYTIALKSEAI